MYAKKVTAMLKQEAIHILQKCDEYIGQIHPGETIVLDGHFTVEQLEAVATLMKVAAEDDKEVVWTAQSESDA